MTVTEQWFERQDEQVVIMDANEFKKHSVTMKQTPQTRLLQSLLSTNTPNDLIQNVHAEMFVAKIGTLYIPITRTVHSESMKFQQNCYLVSLFGNFIAYAREELRLVKNMWLPFELFFRAVIYLFEFVFDMVEIDNVVMVNNWLVSTNMYPMDLDVSLITELTEKLIQKFPDCYLVFRSTCPQLYPKLYDQLITTGYRDVPCRIVFIVDPNCQNTKTSRSLKSDVQLMNSSKCKYFRKKHEEFTHNDLQKCLELYNLLYLKKYSIQNPQYTLRFIETAFQSEMFEFSGWTSGDTGKLEGFTGTFSLDSVSVNPLFGYNINLPSNHGLYRLCSLTSLLKCIKNKTIMHMSSGANDFKLKRGAQSSIEFLMIYSKHLPLGRRIVIWLLQLILVFASSVVEKIDC